MGLFRTAAAMIAAGLFAATSVVAQPAQVAAKVLPMPAASPVSPPTYGAAPTAVGADQGRPMTAQDVEAWLDGFMPYALQSGDVAGAVVVVVKDGQVLVQKGYGYADIAKKKPVDPETTLFRPGSTSKLFTWTAVMQQVEQGKLDLDTDVNQYLDFKIPPGPGGKPVTLRDIMTHTAGFEESVKELLVTDPKAVPPLREAVSRRIPKRIYAPGVTTAYSNYATALAGYLVERVSGLDFDTYVERNIFAPLGMTHATFRQPLPANLKGDMATAYSRASEPPKNFEYVSVPPAGALSASGGAMAKFMIAHLQNGTYGGAQILKPETAIMMHGTPRTLLPPLNRMLLGFYESNTNGHRVITHGGDLQYFHTVLHLWPDDNVGLYISMNSAGREGAVGPIRAALFREFADRYLPGPGYTGQVDAKTAAEHAKMIAGTYDSSRRVETSLVSLVNLVGPITVTANKDGTISVSIIRGLGGAPKKWREISPFVWVEENGKSRLAAKVEGGKVVRFSIDDYAPIMFFDRSPAWKSAAWLVPASVAALAVLLLTVVMWPVTAIVRRRYGHAFALQGQDARAYRLVRIGALLSAGAVILWGLTVVSMLQNIEAMSPKMDPVLLALQVLGSLAVFAGLAIAGWNAWVVWRGQRSWFAKLWSALILLSTLVLAWLAFAYHLVGFTTTY